MTLLAQPGCLLRRHDNPAETGVVLHVSQWGMVLHKVGVARHGGDQCILKWRKSDDVPWFNAVIHDINEWQVIELKALPPCEIQAKSEDGGLWGVGVICGKPKSLLECAAEHGLRGVTVPFLKKLVKHLDIVTDRMPDLEYDLVRLIITTAFPAIDDETLATWMGRRGAMKAARFMSFLDPEDDIDMLAEVIGEDDCAQIRKDARDYQKRVKFEKAQAEKAAAAACGRRGPRGAAGSKEVTPAMIKDACRIASRMMPPLGMFYHNEAEHRVRTAYPEKAFPPYTCSRFYKDLGDDTWKVAVGTVLKWVWNVHCDHCKSACCPWSFDELCALGE